MCGRHRFHFTWRWWLLAFLLILVIGGFFLPAFNDSDLAKSIRGYAFAPGIFGWLMLWIILLATAIQVREIDSYWMTLSGVSRVFVKSYKQWKLRNQTDETPFWA